MHQKLIQKLKISEVHRKKLKHIIGYTGLFYGRKVDGILSREMLRQLICAKVTPTNN